MNGKTVEEFLGLLCQATTSSGLRISTEGVLLSRYYLLQNENEKALESIQQAAKKNATQPMSIISFIKLLQLQPEADTAETFARLPERFGHRITGHASPILKRWLELKEQDFASP
ncbi:MAG: hypothetical protein U0905_06085 [Pirellulales bacterium]